MPESIARLSRPTVDLFVPDGGEVYPALTRATHMAIGAHQDDLEVFAYQGIAACFEQTDRHFVGVTVTNGAGSPRTGPYSNLSDEQMQATRLEEQRQAASIGKYSLQAQLGYASSELKSANAEAVEDLRVLLSVAQPEVLYLHNPFDKHDTHIAALAQCLEALNALDPASKPKRVLGCEVWRSLDWLPDSLKVVLDAHGPPQLADQLLKVFDSQIAGGKRYDLAAIGRRQANATFYQSHEADELEFATYAIDLAPIVHGKLSAGRFVESILADFSEDVEERWRRLQVQPKA